MINKSINFNILEPEIVNVVLEEEKQTDENIEGNYDEGTRNKNRPLKPYDEGKENDGSCCSH